MSADSAATAGPATMQAIVQDAYGGTEVLRHERTALPQITDGEVLVRVQAAGLDRGTWHLMTGRPYLMRVIGFGFRRPKNPVPGIDVAGTVVAIGGGVTRFAVGDEVCGIARGSFAEYAAAREDKLVAKPAALSFAEAAALPVSSLAAQKALVDVGRVQEGQRVLVIGASGGVGSYAVQLAVAAGAEVTGVCSTAKLDHVRSLGATHVVDHTREDFAARGERYDLVLDIGGNPSLRRLRRALAPRGTAVIVGGEHGGDLTGGMGRQLRGLLLSLFVKQRFAMAITSEAAADLERVTALVEEGKVRPSLDRTFPLAEAREAMRSLESGEVRGKVALVV